MMEYKEPQEISRI